MIRIKKDGREFTASRMEIVRELVRRGLLRGEDPVSVDGGPFIPAGEVPELSDCLEEHGAARLTDTDPWHHWSSTSLDSGEWETEADGVLSSFLDVVTASSIPTLQAFLDQEDEQVRTGESEPVLYPEGPQRHSDPDAFPPSLSAVAPVAPVLDDEPELKPEPEPQPEPQPEPEPEPELEPAPDPEFESDPDSGLPLSFVQWMEDRQESSDSLSQSTVQRPGGSSARAVDVGSGFSIVRVILALAVCLAVVAGVRTWIYTGAHSDFPKESELLARASKGTTPSASGDDAIAENELLSGGDASGNGSLGVDTVEDLDARVRRIRNEVTGNIVPFSSAEMLENSLFQEFLNLGAQPLSVKVEALRVRGSLDKDSRRPVLANLELEFQGIGGEDGEERMALFEERLLTAWVVLGKYATLGKVSLDKVRISVRAPTPWDERYEGRTLAGLWTGNIQAEQLFIR